jgi:hypothetical protein
MVSWVHRDALRHRSGGGRRLIVRLRTAPAAAPPQREHRHHDGLLRPGLMMSAAATWTPASCSLREKRLTDAGLNQLVNHDAAWRASPAASTAHPAREAMIRGCGDRALLYREKCGRADGGAQAGRWSSPAASASGAARFAANHRRPVSDVD